MEASGTNNYQIVSFHDQAGGQEHSPEDRFLIFFQGLAYRQQSVSGITLLRTSDELNGVRVAQFEVLELALGGDDLLYRHAVLEVTSFEMVGVEM